VQELISNDWLARERGRGTFVRGKQLIGLALLSNNLSLTEQFPPDALLKTQILARTVLEGPKDTVSRLGLPRGSQVLFFRRLRSMNDRPVMVCDSYLPYDRFSDLKTTGWVNDSLYATLEQKYGYVVERSERSLAAGELLDQQVAECLQVPPFSPMLSLKGLTFVEGETHPIEYMEAFVRECVAFSNTVVRREQPKERASETSAIEEQGKAKP